MFVAAFFIAVPVHASVWRVNFDLPGATEIRSLAFDPSGPALIVSADGISRLHPDGTSESLFSPLKGSKTVRVTKGDGKIEYLKGYKPTYLAPTINGDFFGASGSLWESRVIAHHSGSNPKAIPEAVVGMGHEILTRKGTPNETKWWFFNPSSVAVNGRGVVFFSAGEDVKGHISVYELHHKDALGDWHATRIGTAKGKPRLISTSHEKIAMFVNELCDFVADPVAGSRINLVVLPAQLSDSVKRLIGEDMSSVRTAQDDDNATFISDPVNQVVWRLSADGKTLNQLVNNESPFLTRKFVSGPIALASGGVFVANTPAIRFIGPDDEFETQLTNLVSDAEKLARKGLTDAANAKIQTLEDLIRTSTGMPQWRARMAWATLWERLGPKAAEQLGIPSRSTKQAKPKRKKCCCCF